MKIFDAFLFFNELELLEIRLNTLAPYVDYFVITEADVTFSGKPKPLYYQQNKSTPRAVSDDDEGILRSLKALGYIGGN